MLAGHSFAETAIINGGSYLPLYGDSSKVEINKFEIDKAPVTKKDFLDFARTNQEWMRSKVKRIFAEKTYLQDWESDTAVPEGSEDSPVTYVSWYAAQAYCRHKGMRLPSVDEWEFVAMADGSKPDARSDQEFIKSILAGYEAPRGKLLKVKQSNPNYYGIHDLHGLVWEWVLDFNSIIMSGESRNGSDKGLFCAAGAAGSTDLMNYAAFMRYAFRASLNAKYTIKNLGFRCAKGA